METADAVSVDKLAAEVESIAAERAAKVAAGRVLYWKKKAAKVATEKLAVDKAAKAKSWLCI